MILVLTVSIPLLLLIAYAIYSDMQQSILHTKSALRIVGETMVRNTGSKISRAKQILEKLAARPLVKLRDPEHCDPVLTSLKSLNPEYANIGYSNLTGRVVCSAVPSPTGKPLNMFNAPWYQTVLRKQSFSISKPFLGPFTKKWVIVLSTPIWNDDLEMAGVISMPLDSNSFDPNIPAHLLPENSRYGYFSEDGTMVWRNVDPDHLIGTRPESDSAQKIVSVRQGEFESVAFDGLARYISVTPIPDTGLIAFVSVPASSLYAEAKRRAFKSTIAGLAVISALLLIALAISRRITKPVMALEQASRAVREGNLNVRAVAEGPREVVDVALEFNQMIETQQMNLEELRIAASAFESHESMMITDANARILRVNGAFTRSTGYSQGDIEGKTPRVLKSGRHDEYFYREMWRSLNESGEWSGEIWDRRKSGEVFPKWLSITAVKNAAGVVTHYVCSHIDISELKLAEEKINNLAYFDPLTMLPNRRLLMDRLQHAMETSARAGTFGALMFMDLDNFKSLNDTLGHEVGDLLLKQVAERLNDSVRKGDTVSRLGGDEFVVLLENLGIRQNEVAAQVENISQKIMTALAHTFYLDMHEFNCTASIGVTLFAGNDKQSDDLMKQADIAMYQSKKSGKNMVSFFDGKMQEIVSKRMRLEVDMRKAVTQQQFRMYYHRLVDDNLNLYGAEALIRWQHPDHGFLMPSEFIPLAEDTGMILPIGHWVIAEACRLLADWSANPNLAGLCLSVNISAKQFHLPTFAEEVLALINHYGINPEKLKFEVTESMLLDRVEEIIGRMNLLRTHGIRFALDDFGTGYSSLQYLKRLPIDQLKIDQSFVRDIKHNESDQAIVRTIIAMAHSLNLDVISEGVETEAQFQLLKELGCKHFQGFMFGFPVSRDNLEASILSPSGKFAA